jgi:hypothetical protein
LKAKIFPHASLKNPQKWGDQLSDLKAQTSIRKTSASK